MPTQATIAITPGSGQLLDAVSLVISAQTVVRETMVLADPTSATELAAVSGGALHVSEATLDGCITANVLAVSLPTAQITTLTPPTAAAIGTAVSGDLLIGTQAAGSSVPVALPTATITTLTPPTAAAIAAAIVANPPTVAITGTVSVTEGTNPWIVAGGGTAGTAATGVLTVQGIAAMTPLLVTATFSAPQHIIVDSGTITAVTTITNPVTVAQATAASLNATVVGTGTFAVQATLAAETTKVIGAVNQAAASNPWVISGAVTTSGTATVVGTLTHNNAAPAATNVGVLPAIANATPPTLTEGDQVLHSADLQGNTRVRPGAPKTANWTSLAINCNANGDNVIVAAVGGQTVRVMRIFFVNCDASLVVNVTIKDTGGTAFTGPMRYITAGSFNGVSAAGEPLYVSGTGNGIKLTTDAAVQLSGTVWYTQS